MENDKVSVTLAGPAKIDGKFMKAGATVLVTALRARQLAAPFDTSDTPMASDFDTEVEETAKVLADLRIKDAVETAVSVFASENDTLKAEVDRLGKVLVDANAEVERLGKALEDAKAEVAAATDNQTDAAGTITDLRNRVTELETALADATKPAAEGDPAPASSKAKK